MKQITAVWDNEGKLIEVDEETQKLQAVSREAGS